MIAIEVVIRFRVDTLQFGTQVHYIADQPHLPLVSPKPSPNIWGRQAVYQGRKRAVGFEMRMHITCAARPKLPDVQTTHLVSLRYAEHSEGRNPHVEPQDGPVKPGRDDGLAGAQAPRVLLGIEH